MKKLLILGVAVLSLTGCSFISIKDTNSSNNSNDNVNVSSNQNTTNNEINSNTNTEGQTSGGNTNTQTEGQTSGGNSSSGTQEQTTGGNTETETGGQTTGGGTTISGDSDDHQPTNTSYSLNDYTTFKFYDDEGAMLANDWNYYIKDTHKIAGELYNGNNGDPTGRGIIFEDRNSYVVSPKFDSWNKIEIRFEIWFSLKTGKKATHTEGEPQFRISAYKADGTFLGTDEFILNGNDVPSNGQCASKKLYMRYPTMNYFVINYDNTIEKGSAIYCPVFHEITLKGWQYE